MGEPLILLNCPMCGRVGGDDSTQEHVQLVR